jgi:hypothetical protein
LKGARATTKKSAYEDLKRLVDHAHLECGQARLNLDRHVSQHRC